MRYQSIGTSNSENQSLIEDSNGKALFLIDGSENFITEQVDCYDVIEFLIIAENVEGDGAVLTYQQSLDGLTWTTVTNNSVDVTFDIDADVVHTLKDFQCSKGGYRRFSYNKGDVTAGDITIKVQNV